MLENQAFGWLKNAISGTSSTSNTTPSTTGNGGGRISKNRAAIECCSDVHMLIEGVGADFGVALQKSLAAHVATAASNVKADAGDAVVESVAASSSASANADTSSPPATVAEDDTHLQDITSRLDRIKTLLYEERSASTNAFHARGSVHNYNWTPVVATGVFKCFTSTSSGNSTKQTRQQDENDNNSDLLQRLIKHLPLLPFEARKSTSAIFNYLLVCGLDGVDASQFASVSTAFGSYVLERASDILVQLVRGHDCRQVAAPGVGGGQGCVDITLLCGSMLRSSLRHPAIYQWMLSDAWCIQLVYPFLDDYVDNPNFDVSSDALETVRVMLTGAITTSGATAPGAMGGDQQQMTSEEQYKQTMEGIASEFLNRKYAEVIDERINKKCLSSEANYMTRRMSLQLLSTILLNRVNYNVMMRYISSSQNLVTILCLLRDPSPHITLDAFQVFKIFVANPAKPPEVVKILFDNKVKLVKYLEGLHKEREKSDEQYRDEKALVIATLEGLEEVNPSS